MHDHRTEIEQDPTAFGVALDAGYPPAGALDRFDDRIGDRPGLDLRTSGDQREIVGKNRFRADFERLELLAFFLFRSGADDLNEC